LLRGGSEPVRSMESSSALHPGSSKSPHSLYSLAALRIVKTV